VSVKRVVIFDVREVGEFDTSHLKGAIRVDPDVDPDAFLKQYGELLKDRTAVFYCSVGYRSSLLVERLVDATGDSTNLVNLRGGIFKWYNEGLAVYDSAGATDEIHPFSVAWGRLLEKRAGKKNVPVP
jgi:rhodanese-related sulfurtransferase